MEYVDESKQEISNSLIDPSLGALGNEDTSAQEKASIARDTELISSLKNYIKVRLNEEEEREKRGETNTDGQEQQAQQEDDHTMTDAPDHNDDGQNHDSKENQQQTDAQALYPILKAVAAC
jgi:hypothetical protein